MVKNPAVIQLEVAYATPKKQVIIDVDVAVDATPEQAIIASGILEQFPEIDQNLSNIGVFGKVCKLHQPLISGDRIEIYRPLLIDPKEQRRQRVAKSKKT